MTTKRPLAPFVLTAAIVVLDQIAKLLVVRGIPRGGVAFRAFGDFFWLTHQRNLGIAFSVGDALAPTLRHLLFILLPLGLVLGLLIYYFRSDEPTVLQRWALTGIMGGGLGNLIDRISRPDGVVDFLSFNFYGLFGLERFPTFNVADMSITLSALLLALTLLLEKDEAR